MNFNIIINNSKGQELAKRVQFEGDEQKRVQIEVQKAAKVNAPMGAKISLVGI